MTREEVLLTILGWDLPAPSILLEADGDICLDWEQGSLRGSLSINPNGAVAWAINSGKHGVDLDEFKTEVLECLSKK